MTRHSRASPWPPGDRLHAVAYRILRDAELAEDATQQALLTIWRDIRQLRDPARFDAWSYRVLVRACYAEGRRTRQWSPGLRLPVDADEPMDELDLVVDRDQLERAFRRLSIDHRAVVVLHHYVDLPLEGVAEALGIPTGTVRSRLHHAMRGIAGGARRRRAIGIAGGRAECIPTATPLASFGRGWRRAQRRSRTASWTPCSTKSPRPTTPAWWPARRVPEMSTLFRLTAVAAVVVLAVIGGVMLLPGTGSGPGGVATPSPTPSPSPSPTPVALGQDSVNRPLAAGTYSVGDPFAVPLTLTVGPGGWTPYGLVQGEFHLGIDVSDQPEPYVAIEVFDGIYPDPCHTEGGAVRSANSTLDEIVQGFSTMTGVEAGPVTDTTVDGRPAKRLTISNTINTDTGGCTGGVMLPLMRSAGNRDVATNGNTTQTIWVVDVNGTPVVIWGESLISSADPAIETVESLLETIHFDGAT